MKWQRPQRWAPPDMAAAAQTKESTDTNPEVRDEALKTLRGAQHGWAQVSMERRLSSVRAFRRLLAAGGGDMAELIRRRAADTLSAEVIPLAEAARFLELSGARILRSATTATKGRPGWLRGVEIVVHREPHGVVLVIGPGNYPLFLPGVQALQALVAGNAVIWKPGTGGKPVADFMAALLVKAGLPRELMLVSDDSIESGRQWLSAGVDKVVMTGSVESGRKVLKQCAEIPVPATVELSGWDACFVFPGADLQRAARALAFGLNLNGGTTCIAPRRVFVHSSISDAFRDMLTATPTDGLSIMIVPSVEAAIDAANQCCYALGASIFADSATARALARRVRAGVVVVNDMIVPTADPRLSFGGRRWSGFGKTRGEEGLLEMTVSKSVVTQTARRLRHLEPAHPRAKEIFEAYLLLRHGGGLPNRMRAMGKLCRAAMGRH